MLNKHNQSGSWTTACLFHKELFFSFSYRDHWGSSTWYWGYWRALLWTSWISLISWSLHRALFDKVPRIRLFFSWAYALFRWAGKSQLCQFDGWNAFTRNLGKSEYLILKSIRIWCTSYFPIFYGVRKCGVPLRPCIYDLLLFFECGSKIIFLSS